MEKGSTLRHLFTLFPTDESCLEEIKKFRYPRGVYCTVCQRITKHYKIRKRTAYACSYCRTHLFPLTGTIFHKSSTPLRVWFFCMLLMTYTHGKISARKIQKEIGVTYKTAWRMRHNILRLMKQNHGDLLIEPERVISVSFFNAFELKVVQKQQVS